MPSVENPVALGLTSGSHRHRASFDFYLLLTLIYCHPGAQITFFKFFLTWGGGGRCFDVGLGSGLWSRSNLYLYPGWRLVGHNPLTLRCLSASQSPVLVLHLSLKFFGPTSEEFICLQIFLLCP